LEQSGAPLFILLGNGADKFLLNLMLEAAPICVRNGVEPSSIELEKLARSSNILISGGVKPEPTFGV